MLTQFHSNAFHFFVSVRSMCLFTDVIIVLDILSAIYQTSNKPPLYVLMTLIFMKAVSAETFTNVLPDFTFIIVAGSHTETGLLKSVL